MVKVFAYPRTGWNGRIIGAVPEQCAGRLVTHSLVKPLLRALQRISDGEDTLAGEPAVQTHPLNIPRSADGLATAFGGIRPLDELSRPLREAIALHARLRSFEAGDVLLEQGDPADSLLILLQGRVEVWLHDSKTVHSLAQLNRPTVIGEIGVITEEVRSASVIATSVGYAAILSKGSFKHIAARYPQFRMALSTLISERIGSLKIDVLYEKTIDRYVVGRRLGRGAMGVVYAATDAESQQQVALKMFRHDLMHDRMATQRFHQEADLVRDLRHPNIVRVLDDFSAFGTSFIVMELCDGPSLSDLVHHVGAMPVPVVRQIVGQLACGMASAHAAGIAHRDLKPSNVLLTRDGTVKVADFGLARHLTTDLAALTTSGQIVGTPRYMAPEQLAGDRGDAKADLYALGVVLYELLSGHPMFPATKLNQLIKERTNWSIPAAGEIRPDLDSSTYRLMQQLLATDPEARNVDLTLFVHWAGPVNLEALGMNACTVRADSGSSTAETEDFEMFARL